MKTKSVTIQTADGQCDAYVAHPDQTAPGVLLLMDIFGIRPYLREMTEHLASQGYYVVTPNLFYRDQHAPLVPESKFPLSSELVPTMQRLMPLARNLTVDKSAADIKTYVEFLNAQKEVKHGKVGVTGYCMGGRHAICAASRMPELFSSVASFHAARLVTDAPDSPHLQVGNIKAELYVAHADHDEGMTPEQQEQLRQALVAGHVRFEAEMYSEAPHGFTMKDLPAYNHKALDKHWQKLLVLLKRNLH
jgi:carboxymethylenebutenolidase